MTADISVRPTDVERIGQWRNMYRAEMACQIIHDSLHYRRGWTQEYELAIADTSVGYGSIAIGGPWKAEHTAFEFYVVPAARQRVFDLFRALLAASGAPTITVQSNDTLATATLHAFTRHTTSESILFHDKVTTSLLAPDTMFRVPNASEAPDLNEDQLPWHGVLDVDGQVAASGGILFHYNRPFGDIYMEVAAPFRRRGLGSFLVQELKRVCYEGGHVPGARTSPDNVASQRTLQRAGFVPCGHILKGSVARLAFFQSRDR